MMPPGCGIALGYEKLTLGVSTSQLRSFNSLTWTGVVSPIPSQCPELLIRSQYLASEARICSALLTQT